MKKPFDVEAHLAETAAAIDRTLDRLLPASTSGRRLFMKRCGTAPSVPASG